MFCPYSSNFKLNTITILAIYKSTHTIRDNSHKNQQILKNEKNITIYIEFSLICHQAHLNSFYRLEMKSDQKSSQFSASAKKKLFLEKVLQKKFFFEKFWNEITTVQKYWRLQKILIFFFKKFVSVLGKKDFFFGKVLQKKGWINSTRCA